MTFAIDEVDNSGADGIVDTEAGPSPLRALCPFISPSTQQQLKQIIAVCEG